MRLQADAEILKTFIRILRTKVLPGEGVKAEGELAMEAPRQQHVPAQRLEWREEAFNGIGETEADEEQVKDSQYAGSCVPAAPVLLTPHAGGKRPMPTCACVSSLSTRVRVSDKWEGDDSAQLYEPVCPLQHPPSLHPSIHPSPSLAPSLALLRSISPQPPLSLARARAAVRTRLPPPAPPPPRRAPPLQIPPTVQGSVPPPPPLPRRHPAAGSRWSAQPRSSAASSAGLRSFHGAGTRTAPARAQPVHTCGRGCLWVRLRVRVHMRK